MPVSRAPVSKRLRCVPEFFCMSVLNEHIDEMGDPPMRMGLIEGKDWPDVYKFMDHFELTHPGRRMKLVILLRHGEATHNATKASVGSKLWQEKYEMLPEFIDAPLTTRGKNQADSAALILEKQITKSGLKLQRVYVSPLDRTLQTYDRVFNRLRDIPVSVVELARETLGVVNCDRRGFLTPKQTAYPQMDFSRVASEDDTWWQPDHRETAEEIAKRAAEFLDELFDKTSERCVLIVSHSGFSRGCFAAVGHHYYRPRNAEFIPLLITDAFEEELH
ncbi:phosphoglycerate mutase family [Plasmopara halstedii]|uniref:Phosphoglycerate mutase family n=1 Tax=Plasmopara halstedii TaxID=4781 RepID=A0A0P1AKL8_PLAHL|nr:phosphoglycerate mutase family [Plasmopara halstedii]CEG41808.1 phosphoglycerate mutase family [Plasmopara halstedii]|eukprot:XP_024578177.1 phosphoglycerate mutase family [Plasmopara halstedii]